MSAGPLSSNIYLTQGCLRPIAIDRGIIMGFMRTSESINADVYSSEEQRWAAVLHRDSYADGHFYYSVKTTGVYCRPSCASRLPEQDFTGGEFVLTEQRPRLQSRVTVVPLAQGSRRVRRERSSGAGNAGHISSQNAARREPGEIGDQAYARCNFSRCGVGSRVEG